MLRRRLEGITYESRNKKYPVPGNSGKACCYQVGLQYATSSLGCSKVTAHNQRGVVVLVLFAETEVPPPLIVGAIEFVREGRGFVGQG